MHTDIDLFFQYVVMVLLPPFIIVANYASLCVLLFMAWYTTTVYITTQLIHFYYNRRFARVVCIGDNPHTPLGQMMRS